MSQIKVLSKPPFPQKFGHSSRKLTNTHCEIPPLYCSPVPMGGSSKSFLFYFLHVPQLKHGSPGSEFCHTSKPALHPHHHRTETWQMLLCVPLGISQPHSLPSLTHSHTDMLLSPLTFSCSSPFYSKGPVSSSASTDLLLPVKAWCPDCLLFSTAASIQKKLPTDKCGSRDAIFISAWRGLWYPTTA